MSQLAATATIPGILDRRSAGRDGSAAEEDARLARLLDARSRELDFAGLLEEHWRLVGKPAALARRFTAHDLAAAAKAEDVLAGVERAYGAPLTPAARVLEVGCGTAALSLAAARRGADVVATDVSLRWLVLARQRLAEAGVAGVRLVCCAAEDDALEREAFDLVLAGDVIEHVADASAFLAACARRLRPRGLLFLATPNRFSLGLEPHVRLPLVGYLPRPLQRRYVEAVKHVPYDHVRLLSARELRRLLGTLGFDATIVAPEVPPSSRTLYRGLERRLVDAYNRACRLELLQPALVALGPFLHVYARRRAA